MSALLELQAAVATRGAFRLGPLDLAMGPGEVVALVGPNGSGKSTALELASGALPARSGRALLGGLPAADLPPRERARRACLLRAPTAPPFGASSLELVLHGRWARLRGLRFPGERDLEACRSALASVDASHLETRDVRSLSTGELQRVLLARALAQGSPLLLLDEPTAHLDLRHRVETLRLVRLACSGGRAALVASHDLDLIGSTCDRAVVLAEGRVLASGAADEVLREDVLGVAFRHALRVDPHPDTGRPRITPRIPTSR